MPNLDLKAMTPTAEQSRDVASADASAALNAALMPYILNRQDAGAIFSRVSRGDQLLIEFAPDALLFEAALVGSDRRTIMAASLTNDPASADLRDVLGVALTAALNCETPERRREIAEQVAGAAYIVRLRVNGGTEGFRMHLVRDARVIWQSPERVVQFDPSGCLTGPSLH